MGEKEKILRMLDEGKVSVEEAKDLLNSIDGEDETKEKRRVKSAPRESKLNKLWLFSAILLIGGMIAGVSYNKIVDLDNRVQESKSQIEVALKRRFDLIPNLVNTVKGYAEHEKSTLTEVIKARNEAVNTLKTVTKQESLTKEEVLKLSQANHRLNKSLKSMWVLVERYPDLKAKQNFVILQDQLEGTENRISVARQRYNSIVRKYNSMIDFFPLNIMAVIFNFEKKEYLNFSKKVEKNVEVEF